MQDSSDGFSTALVSITAVIAILIMVYSAMEMMQKRDDTDGGAIELYVPLTSADSQP